MTIHECVTWVIDTFEGHLYTDDPVDMGGATRHGITQRTLQYYRRKFSNNPTLVVTKDDVRNLSMREAVDCGVYVFAIETNVAKILDWRVMMAVYDYGFHSGMPRAVMALQQSVGLAVHEIDGQLGSKTLHVVNSWGDHRGLALDILTDREEFMQGIMERKQTQRRFMLGWWKRTTQLQRVLLKEI